MDKCWAKCKEGVYFVALKCADEVPFDRIFISRVFANKIFGIYFANFLLQVLDFVFAKVALP